MDTKQLLKALSALIALERYSNAEDAAEQIPDWLPVVDVLRAKDGVEQLARAISARRPHNEAA